MLDEHRECSVQGCEKPHMALGWCKSHYRKFKRWGDPLYVPERAKDRVCEIEGCANPQLARSLCNLHYIRWNKYGDPLYLDPSLVHPPTCEWIGSGGSTCDKPWYANGLCVAHDRRRARGHYMDAPIGAPGKRARPAMTEAARFWAKVRMDGPVPDHAPHLGPCWPCTHTVVGEYNYPRFTLSATTDSRCRSIKACRWAYQQMVGPIVHGVIIHKCLNKVCVNPQHLEDITLRELARRLSAFVTECVAGHPFDDANTGYLSDGSRYCRMCHSRHNQARRAVGSGQDYDVAVIGDRDGWICGICGEPVDPLLGGRTSLSRSIDHIQPVSMGGTNGATNLRICHFGCNSRRGNGIKNSVVLMQSTGS